VIFKGQLTASKGIRGKSALAVFAIWVLFVNNPANRAYPTVQNIDCDAHFTFSGTAMAVPAACVPLDPSL